MSACDHITAVQKHDRVVPTSPEGCQDCLALPNGEGKWLHLRLCLTCGHVGCCEDSPHQHAKHHAHDSGHHVIQSFQPGEAWLYCYADDTEADPTATSFITPPGEADRSSWRPVEEQAHGLG